MEETRATTPPHLATVGRLVEDQIATVLRRYVDRLRQDPLTPRAADMAQVDLEDHAASFLADIAQALVILEDSQVPPDSLLRDGSEIQRVIAELHGRQRAQLGWTAESLGREWDILAEEIGAAVKKRLPSDSGVGDALDLLTRFLDRARRISLRSRRYTAETT